MASFVSRIGMSIAAVAIVAVIVLGAFPGAFTPSHTTMGPSGVASVEPVTTGSSGPGNYDVTFAITNDAALNDIFGNSSMVVSGDSFEIVASNPTTINNWALELHDAFPGTKIYAHVSGITNFETLAPEVGKYVTGIYYDYEPGYEPEWTYNFADTEVNFRTVAAVAKEYGIQSVGYPSGLPLLKSYLADYHWNYATLGGIVSRMVIQAQLFCQLSTADYARALGVVVDQYAAAGLKTLPEFQITVGSPSVYPHAVDPAQAYACAQVAQSDGLKASFVWWGTNGTALHQFMHDIGRTKNNGGGTGPGGNTTNPIGSPSPPPANFSLGPLPPAELPSPGSTIVPHWEYSIQHELELPPPFRTSAIDWASVEYAPY